MQDVSEFFIITPQAQNKLQLNIELQPNEFKARDDSIGLSFTGGE